MGLGVFGFPLQEVPFFIIGKEVLTNFCKEIKNFLQQYKSSWPKKKKCVSKGKLINLIKRTWRYYYAVIWRCIQNIMRQNSIMHGQIFNFYYFKKQTHTHMHTHYYAHARAHTYTHIYGTALQTLPLLDKSFSERITGKVFKFCFINLLVIQGYIWLFLPMNDQQKLMRF